MISRLRVRINVRTNSNTNFKYFSFSFISDSVKQNNVKNEFPNEKHFVGNESDKDINYDEYEFTFMPQEINKSTDRRNNKINDLNSDESNKNTDKLLSNEELKKLDQNNDNNYHRIQRLTQMMNSMPLPQPFSMPSRAEPPFFGQMPVSNNGNWRVPPMSRGFSYGWQSTSQEFTNFGGQLPLNWNPNY